MHCFWFDRFSTLMDVLIKGCSVQSGVDVIRRLVPSFHLPVCHWITFPLDLWRGSSKIRSSNVPLHNVTCLSGSFNHEYIDYRLYCLHYVSELSRFQDPFKPFPSILQSNTTKTVSGTTRESVSHHEYRISIYIQRDGARVRQTVR